MLTKTSEVKWRGKQQSDDRMSTDILNTKAVESEYQLILWKHTLQWTGCFFVMLFEHCFITTVRGKKKTPVMKDYIIERIEICHDLFGFSVLFCRLRGFYSIFSSETLNNFTFLLL